MKNLTYPFFDWDRLEWIIVDENIRRKQIWMGKIMHALVEIKAGAAAPIHRHPHEQTGYILQGTLKVTVEDHEKILKAGEGYLVPSNAPHGVVVTGDTDALIFDTFTPVRQDFLK